MKKVPQFAVGDRVWVNSPGEEHDGVRGNVVGIERTRRRTRYPFFIYEVKLDGVGNYFFYDTVLDLEE